jgi:hypothetical protein
MLRSYVVIMKKACQKEIENNLLIYCRLMVTCREDETLSCGKKRLYVRKGLPWRSHLP